MKSERIAVYTTVYPGVEKYLAPWYRSIRGQRDQDFDLWVGVDSLSEERVLDAMGARAEPIHLIAASGSPSEIRQKAIGTFIDEYSQVVFVDSDDLLYPTRIAAARKALERYDAVGCALRIIDEKGRDLGITFGQAEGKDLGSLLPRYNIFGLSNTAYRTSLLRCCMPFASDCQLVDWLLATRAWASGADLYFDPQPHMSYRQYDANIARVLPPFSSQQVVEATTNVVRHYSFALESEHPIAGSCAETLHEAYARAAVFQQAISGSSETLASYVAELNRKAPRYVWWWCVAHPELEYIWRN